MEQEKLKCILETVSGGFVWHCIPGCEKHRSGKKYDGIELLDPIEPDPEMSEIINRRFWDLIG